MGDFHRNKKERFGLKDSGRSQDRKFSRPRGSFDRMESGRRGGDSEHEMHEVTCDRCGKRCEVPFRPTGGKPVYCSECFRNKDDSEPRGRHNASSGQLAEINRKLDKIIEALGLEE